MCRESAAGQVSHEVAGALLRPSIHQEWWSAFQAARGLCLDLHFFLLTFNLWPS